MLKITGKDEVDIGYSQNTHTHTHTPTQIPKTFGN